MLGARGARDTAAMADRKKSGPSGKHIRERRILSASPEQWATWGAAAKSHGLTLSAWLRLSADRQATLKTLR
jgi:hypothetical protein